jgi:hypothetical protein
MTKTILLGTLIGGIILFAWSAVSWELLPWHTSSFRSFSNEDAMTQALLAGAKQNGMYSIPGGLEDNPNQEKLIKGPFMFAAVRPGPMGPVAPMFIGQALIQFAAAFMLTLLLMQVHALSFARRVLFVAGIGLAGGVAAFLPEMNWWGFSAAYTLVNVADMTIGFTLAGVALAKIV